MQVEELQPCLRLCEIRKAADGSCGFHLSRTQSDPYPWVSNVVSESPAGCAGLSIGDCVLEVNGEDILGLKISQVAEKVRAKAQDVILLVWNTSEAPGTNPAILNLQKLSSYFESAVQLLECPVCLEISSAPTYQCCNGHIVCGNCRPRTHKCPICRVVLPVRGRCLLAEKLHLLLVKTFAMKHVRKVGLDTKTQEAVSLDVLKKPHLVCPWGSGCYEVLEGPQMVMKHVRNFHGGPIIQYYMKNTRVTIQRPRPDTLVTVQDQDGTIFFCQLIQQDMFYVSVLGDEAKADNYEYVVNNGKYHRTNGLTTPTEQVVARKWYHVLQLGVEDIQIEIRCIDGQ